MVFPDLLHEGGILAIDTIAEGLILLVGILDKFVVAICLVLLSSLLETRSLPLLPLLPLLSLGLAVANG